MPSRKMPSSRVKAIGRNQPNSFKALLNRLLLKRLWVSTPIGADQAAYQADMTKAVLEYRATSDTTLLRMVFITYFPVEAKAEEAARLAAEPARLAAEAALLAAEVARIEAEYQARKTGIRVDRAPTYAQATQSLRKLSYADVALMRPEYYTNSVATQVC